MIFHQYVLTVLALPHLTASVQQSTPGAHSNPTRARQQPLAVVVEKGGAVSESFEAVHAHNGIHKALARKESTLQIEKIGKGTRDAPETITDDAIEQMLTSASADSCRKTLSQKYSAPERVPESDWSDTAIPGTNWTIRDKSVVELQCGGTCNAPEWICGSHWVFRAWSAGNGVYHNYDLRDMSEERASSLGIPSPIRQRLRWHEMTHTPDESASLLSAATFAPTSWSTDWLMLGLGSGSKADFIHWATPWSLDAVDIDRRVLDVAQRYFAFPQLPLRSSKDRQCLGDQRMCVTISDAFDYVNMLANTSRQYGVAFVDIGSVIFDWDLDKQAHFSKVLASLARVVILNPANWDNFEIGLRMVKKGFHETYCLPLPADDDRKCWVLGLSQHALGNEDALAQAARMDKQMGWMPFSLATHLRTHPLKPFNLGKS